MSVPELRSAEKVVYEEWEKVHNKPFSDVLRLFDAAMMQARENAPEGWGFTAEAAVGGCQLKLAVASPPRAGGGWGGKGGGSVPAFSRDKVQAVVMENPDLLSIKEEGGRVTVSTKRYLDKGWEGVNGRLREAGMRYVRENKMWEQT
ncbi:hypothetical protein MUO93_11915 [Candidatus Bathyarchaeota archaeon]|nr:hypothetical protein [Candidatus Bathyarchaeota archaeon]